MAACTPTFGHLLRPVGWGTRHAVHPHALDDSVCGYTRSSTILSDSVIDLLNHVELGLSKSAEGGLSDFGEPS